MPRMRALLAAVVLSFATGCIWTSGPDCAAACDKIVHCPDVKGTYLLSCNNVNGDCYDVVANCAACIADKNCSELAAGACDSVCKVSTDGGQ